MKHHGFTLIALIGLLQLSIFSTASLIPNVSQADDLAACRIVVVDQENGWRVPLVELRTTNHLRFVTDNNGIIAIDDPTLLDREVWFSVIGHGYGVAPDGFGYRGIRLTPRAGKTLTIKVHRTSIAKRIGRLTGTGLFAESQKLGDEKDWREGPVTGCDSVQTAVHRGKLYWAWGDTNVLKYPLGVFHMTSATTSRWQRVDPQGASLTFRPFSLEPPLRPRFDYWLDDKKKPRPIARMPGDGPTWLTGYVSLPDKNENEHLVALYRKIKPPLEVYEAGQCVWNDESEKFEHLRTIWKKSDNVPAPTLIAEGHPSFWTDEKNRKWVLFGNPLPSVKIPATYEAWQDLSQWEELAPQKTMESAEDKSPVTIHSGSIAWNEFRKQWVTVFVQKFGKPSFLGTLWYAEADSPLGPWGPAVKILSHDNYTFYNPRLHPEFTLLKTDFYQQLTPQKNEPVLFFEGTYTAEFAKHPNPTPRYNYNQILYRLDLDAPELKRAQNR